MTTQNQHVLYCLFWCCGFCLDTSDVIGRKVCSSHGAGYKTIAATAALGIASAREHDQGKTKPAEQT